MIALEDFGKIFGRDYGKNFWTRKGAGQNKSNKRSGKIPKIHPGYYVNYIALLHNSIVHNAQQHPAQIVQNAKIKKNVKNYCIIK